MLQKPERIIRTTIGEYFAHPNYEGAGIYVISCYPTLGCLYVGRTEGRFTEDSIERGVYARLRQHLASEDMIGTFLRNNFADACSFGLDILVPPNNSHEWFYATEAALIKQFRPFCNSHLLGESTYELSEFCVNSS